MIKGILSSSFMIAVENTGMGLLNWLTQPCAALNLTQRRLLSCLAIERVGSSIMAIVDFNKKIHTDCPTTWKIARLINNNYFSSLMIKEHQVLTAVFVNLTFGSV